MNFLLNRFFELALSEVHRYEGTLNQFLGDGFMAPVRGANCSRGPRAAGSPGRSGLQKLLHEHHAERGE